MTLDIKKFIQDEGLSLKRFDEWLKTSHDTDESADKLSAKLPIPIDSSLVKDLIERIKGKKEAHLIMSELDEGKVVVESSTQYFVVLKYSNGSVRIPRPMMK